jgi:hypothetical protein
MESLFPKFLLAMGRIPAGPVGLPFILFPQGPIGAQVTGLVAQPLCRVSVVVNPNLTRPLTCSRNSFPNGICFKTEFYPLSLISKVVDLLSKIRTRKLLGFLPPMIRYKNPYK